MKPLFTIIFVAIATASFAQKLQNVYFLKNDGSYLKSPKGADFMRVISQPDLGDSLYNVIETYPNGNRRLIGKSINSEIVRFEGVATFYYPNEKKAAINNYKNNLFIGEQSEFFPNGNLYMVKRYKDDGEINNTLRPFLIIANYDSTGNILAENGNGSYKLYSANFKKVIEEGSIKNGYKDGKITGNYRNNQYEETYSDGKFIEGTSTNKDKTVRYKDVMGTLPEYPGGMKAFSQFLGNNIIYPEKEREKNVQGRVILEFIVNESGELSDFKILRSPGKAFDNEALRVMKISPKWLPGTMRGNPVRAQFTVPISFTLSGPSLPDTR